MLNPNSTLASLLTTPMNPGRIVWIGIRPARREPVISVQAVIAEAGKGLVGDRYKTSTNGPRQVTLIQAEHLAAIASYLGRDSIDPEMLRRNIVVQGINLFGDERQTLSNWQCVTGIHRPVPSLVANGKNLSVGGYNALRGHGGITARVLVGGEITLEDSIYVVTREASVRA